MADRNYRGQFYQITRQTRNDAWPPQWPQAAGGSLTTFFTGTVLATLLAQHDQTMRC